MKKLLVTPFLICLGILTGFGQNFWLQKANFGGGVRTTAAGFSIGTTGYILTGTTGSVYQMDVWAWKQSTNTWTQKNNFPGGARIGAAGVSLNGKGYVIGGHATTGFLKDVWVYDTGTDSWTQKASFPDTARYYAVCVADPTTKKIYYGSGDFGGSTYLSDWWSYDPSIDSWTQLANIPGGQRSYGCGFFAGGNIYAGTGNNNNVTTDAMNDWWRYDTASNTWTQMSNVPGNARRDACTFVIGLKGYICLGTNSALGTMDDLWMFDPITNTWSSRANYGGGPGAGAVGFSIGNKGYVGTGFFPTSPSSIYWEFTPIGEDTITGITTLDSKAGALIYPNPSNGVFNLNFSGLNYGPAEIVISDLRGNIVDKYSIADISSNIKINESALNNGCYFYEIIANNKLESVGKFLILK